MPPPRRYARKRQAEAAEPASDRASKQARKEALDDLPILKLEDTPPSVSGKEMLQRLRGWVVENLSRREQAAFEDFVVRMNKTDHSRTDLAKKQWTDALLDVFKDKEASTSGKPRDSLINLSGNVAAILGLIMHYPTFVKSTKELFDEHNPCVLRLMKKGLNAANCVAFDWHWRQERSAAFQERNSCPKTAYSSELLELHNELSADLARNLEMPLLILVSECVWSSYHASMKGEGVRKVKLQVAPSRTIELSLLFSDEGRTLKRVAFNCCHPDGIFRERSAPEAALRACTIDSGLNLLLGLAGIETRDEYFRHFLVDRGMSYDANLFDPIKEVKSLIAEELKSARVTPLSEIRPALLDWATAKYPDFDPERRVLNGVSVLQGVQDEISSAISIGLQKTKGTILTAAPEYGRVQADSNVWAMHRRWHNQLIRYKPSPSDGATFILLNVPCQDDMSKCVRHELPFSRQVNGQHFENLSGKAKIYFGADSLYLRRTPLLPPATLSNLSIESARGPIIWELEYRLLSRRVGGLALVEHARHEHREALESNDAEFNRDVPCKWEAPPSAPGTEARAPRPSRFAEPEARKSGSGGRMWWAMPVDRWLIQWHRK